MTPSSFERHLRFLMDIEPNQDPLFSCFLNITDEDGLRSIDAKIEEQRYRLPPHRWGDYDEVVSCIQATIAEELHPKTKGLVVYMRLGDHPIYVPMQFEVPLRNDWIVHDLPVLYPLVELKDTLHRFVIAIVSEKEGRILETTFGSVTHELMVERPDLLLRTGREWTQEHYRERGYSPDKAFIWEKVEMIDRLMSARGLSHLVLAGTPAMVSRLQQALPSHLFECVVGSFGERRVPSDVDPLIVRAIEEFAKAEQADSRELVRELKNALLKGGLAVAGVEATRLALESDMADVLVIDQGFEDAEVREELIRLAVQRDVTVETVAKDLELQRLGGAGCLLRHHAPGLGQRLLLST